jgi:hypothetical protein
VFDEPGTAHLQHRSLVPRGPEGCRRLAWPEGGTAADGGVPTGILFSTRRDEKLKLQISHRSLTRDEKRDEGGERERPESVGGWVAVEQRGKPGKYDGECSHEQDQNLALRAVRGRGTKLNELGTELSRNVDGRTIELTNVVRMRPSRYVVCRACGSIDRRVFQLLRLFRRRPCLLSV